MEALLKQSLAVLLVAWSLTGAGLVSAEADATAGASAFFAATLSDLEDKPVALESLRGKPMVVNFWARWCGPCRDEIPELIKAHDRHRKGGLTIVGVAVEDNTPNVRDFAAAYKMSYLVLMGKDKSIDMMRDLGNSKAGLPFTVAIDRDGRIVARKTGLMKKADLDGFLKALQIAP
jgi:thiol-disulfide isomerase/thioredoxin